MRAGNTIMIAATQRTGSTLVFDDLRNVLGRGREDSELLYNTLIGNKPTAAWAELWPGLRARALVAGHALHKVMFHYVPLLSLVMEGTRPTRLRPVLDFRPEAFATFMGFFADALWVRVYRRDKLAQAVSMFLAEKTGVWEWLVEARLAGRPARVEPPYDRDALLAKLRQFVAEDAMGQACLRHFGIVAVDIAYEDAIVGYPAYLDATLRRAGLVAMAPPPARRMLKLGDAMHARMIERLREDARREPDLRDLVDL